MKNKLEAGCVYMNQKGDYMAVYGVDDNILNDRPVKYFWIEFNFTERDALVRSYYKCENMAEWREHPEDRFGPLTFVMRVEGAPMPDRPNRLDPERKAKLSALTGWKYWMDKQDFHGEASRWAREYGHLQNAKWNQNEAAKAYKNAQEAWDVICILEEEPEDLWAELGEDPLGDWHGRNE